MRSKLFTAGALTGVLWLAGCEGLNEQQRMWLAQGERAYSRQQYRRAIQHLTRFVDEASEAPEVGRALYIRGLASARTGQRTQARTDLLRCLRSTRDADVRWRAFAVLGTLDYEDRQWAAAAHAYQAAAATAPQRPPTDMVLFRAGVCHERSGRWAAARGPYQRIVAEFPGGGAGRAAQRRLQINAEHFAVQCGVFGKRENAEHLVTDLKREDLPAYVRTEPRGGVRAYVVLVGRYAGYEEALQGLARVKGHGREAVLWP